MSRAATDWAFSQELPALQKLVLLVLANRHNSETARCDPSLVRLAKDCGLDKATIRRTLSTLSRCGLLVRTRRKVEGVFASTAYTLQMGVVAESDNGSRGAQQGVGAQRPYVEAENPYPVEAQRPYGRGTEPLGVGAQRPLNQEVKPVREPKEETSTPKRQKLTVIRQSPKSQNPSFSEIPSGMPSEPWMDYLAMRTERRKPPTPTAAKLLVRKIEKLTGEGHDPALLLNKATERGWLTVYPSDDTKAPPRKVEYVELTDEQARERWERDFGRASGV